MAGERNRTGVRAAKTIAAAGLATLAGLAVSWIRRIPPAALPAAERRRDEALPLDGLPSDRRGWSRPQPEHLVKPTYWPMITSLGIALALWGVVNTLFLTWVGVVLLIYALANCIGELRHDP